MPSLFAFDLHGTLIKGNEHALLIVTNRSLEKHRRKERFDLGGIKKMYGRPWGDYFRVLCPGVSDKEVNSMVDCAREFALGDDMKIIRQHAKPMDNCLGLLNEIKKGDNEILIISNTTTGALRGYLEIVGIFDFVDHILGITKEDERKGFDVKFVLKKCHAM